MAPAGLPNDSLSAVLEYDAFGQEVRSTGPASDLAPFHFSTKFTDQESGLNYYGYRYYDSAKGRWLNRDPIGETGGKNLFGVDGNNFMAYIDVLGKARPCSQKFKSNYMGYEDIIPFSTCDAYNSDPYYLPDQAQNPKGGYRNHDVYDEVGGGLDKSHDSGDRDYQDSCALRVSLALNGCGEPHRIPTGDGEPVPDGKHPKDNQIVNAKAMCAYLRKKWGPPDYTVSSVRELYLILNKNTCECFSVVFCNSHHVGHADASMVDYAGPGKNSSVWKLPCCGADE